MMDEEIDQLREEIRIMKTTALISEALLFAVVLLLPNREEVHELYQGAWNQIRGGLGPDVPDDMMTAISDTLARISGALDKQVL